MELNEAFSTASLVCKRVVASEIGSLWLPPSGGRIGVIIGQPLDSRWVKRIQRAGHLEIFWVLNWWTPYGYVCLKIVYQQNPLDDHNFPYENSHYWGYTILNHPFFGGEIVPRTQLEIRLGNGGSLSFRAFPLTRRHLWLAWRTNNLYCQV